MKANKVRDDKLFTVKCDNTAAYTRHGGLVKKVNLAKTQSVGLKEALTKGFEELEKTIAENQVDL